MPMIDDNNLELTPQDQDGAQDYIDTINELKNNSVPKDKYDRILQENKRLLKSIANGEGIEVQAPKTPTIEETVAPLADRENQMLSLEFAEKSLAFRDAVMAKGKRDPYLPQGEDITLTAQNYETAQKMADALKHCIEVADGDEAVFLNEWNRIYVPSPIGQARGRR